MPDSRVVPKGAYPSKLVTMWMSDRTGAEERWDMETLY
jgi:hypothetical protein